MKKCICFVLAVLLLLSLCACAQQDQPQIDAPPQTDPQTQPTIIKMYAVQVNKQGAVLEDCTLTLAITEEPEEEEAYTSYRCEITFGETEQIPFEKNEFACTWYPAPQDCHYRFSGAGYVAADNGFTSAMLYLDTQRETCLLRLADRDVIYVASLKADFEPKAIMESYSEHLETPVETG